MRAHISMLAMALLSLPLLAAENESAVLEEFLVTAQHRTEAARDTPISLFTLNEEQLEKQRISGISNLNGLVPNLNIDNFPANNQALRLFIRGVGLTDTQITQDAAVGVYLDGAYIARSTGLAFDVADLQRIEVLRGPQGTLYGRNTTGGAIKLVTRKADTQNLTFNQTLSTGNRDLFGSKTSLNLPLGERYAVKAAYLYEDVEGFTENEGPGGSFGDRESRGLRLDFHAGFTDRFMVDYGYDYSDIEYYNYTAQAIIPRESGSGPLSDVGDIAQQYIRYGSDRFGKLSTTMPLLPTDTDIEGHTVNTEWKMGDSLSLRSISAYRELRDKSYIDFASGAEQGFRIDFNSAVLGANAGEDGLELAATRPDLDQEQWSQEIQLLGDAGDAIQYLVGLYYFHEEAEEDIEPLHHIFSAFPFNGGTIYNLGAEFNEIENDSLALFTQATWTPKILDRRLHLTLGWRHSEDSRKARRDTAEFVVVDQGTPVAPLLPASVFRADADDDYSDDSFTFITEFDWTENYNVYAKYAEAYKSGGFNIRDPDEAGFSNGFREEKLRSVEAGFKGDLLEGMLRVNAALFYQEFDDFQYNFKIPGTIQSTRVINIDEGEMSGVELELMAMPTRGLLLHLSYAYNDSELDDVINPFSGEVEKTDFTNAPEHTYSLVVDYSYDRLPIGELNANVSYNFVDDRQADNEFLYRDAYELVNARLSLSDVEGLGGRWTFAAWGKNLNDTDYEAFTLDNLPQADRAVIWADALTWGVDITYRYF